MEKKKKKKKGKVFPQEYVSVMAYEDVSRM
jgi:hypothetical protein